MSKLSRGRNPSSVTDTQKSETRVNDESSDDDLIIAPSSRLKSKPATTIQADEKKGASKPNLPNSKKPLKGQLPKNSSKKQGESQKNLEKKTEEWNEASEENHEQMKPSNEDTLLVLEEEIGRRFDENSQPLQHCFDIVLDPAAAAASDIEHQARPQVQVVCPFCWKKLHDKLNGMTHVKTCGKDLPIERIFEALQLHEKQIKEWEQIGISYPGFQGGNVKSKTAASTNGEEPGPGKARKRGGGNTRRKKQNLVDDPDIELALALSASLHEEVVERQRAEINHLTEAGLHVEAVEKAKASEVTSKLSKPQDIQEHDEQEPQQRIANAISEFRLRFTKETKKLPKLKPGTAGEKLDPQQSIPKPRGGRSRNKDLKNTKLFTLTEDEKAVIVVERVAQILDKSEQRRSDLKGPYKVTDDNVTEIGWNNRLDEFCDKESKLWNIASKMMEHPNESFYTAALNECNKNLPASEAMSKEISKTTNNEMKKSEENVNTKNGGNHIVQKAKPINKCLRRNERKSESFSGSRSARMSGSKSVTEACGVGQDFLKLFTRKIDTDLTLYGREEKPIRAHKLILQARCPKLLKDIVTEESPTGDNEIIPLTCFSHMAVKSFTWFLYCGQLFPYSSKDSEDMARYLEEMEELAQKYNIRLDEGQHQSKQKECKCSVEKVNQEVQTMDFVSPFVNKQLSSKNGPNHDEVDIDENSSTCSNSFAEEVGAINSTAIRRMSTESAGSIDLFEDYDNEDDTESEVPNSKNSDESLEKTVKKRSRSISPQFKEEDIIVLGDSPFSQANKKYKSDSVNHSSSHPAGGSGDEISLLNLNYCERKSLADYVLNEIMTPCGSTTFTGEILLNNDNNECARIDLVSPISRRPSEIKGRNSRLSQARRTLKLGTTLTDRDSDSQTRNSISQTLRIALPNSPTSFLSPQVPPDPFLDLNGDNFFHLNQEPVDSNWSIDDNDDSVLARIPEEFLQRNSPPENHYCPARSRLSPELSPIPVHASVPYVSHTLRSQKDNDSVIKPHSKNKKVKPKGAAKGTSRKIISSSQPSQPLQQRNTYEENLALFTNRNSPTTPTMDSAHSQAVSRQAYANNQTPMLNYSTIDTPILKRELKKYGLKPLPRSKAKLLLRHIYKETHKLEDDDDT